jgi:hypothetical protein
MLLVCGDVSEPDVFLLVPKFCIVLAIGKGITAAMLSFKRPPASYSYPMEMQLP